MQGGRTNAWNRCSRRSRIRGCAPTLHFASRMTLFLLCFVCFSLRFIKTVTIRLQIVENLKIYLKFVERCGIIVLHCRMIGFIWKKLLSAKNKGKCDKKWHRQLSVRDRETEGEVRLRAAADLHSARRVSVLRDNARRVSVRKVSASRDKAQDRRHRADAKRESQRLR